MSFFYSNNFISPRPLHHFRNVLGLIHSPAVESAASYSDRVFMRITEKGGFGRKCLDEIYWVGVTPFSISNTHMNIQIKKDVVLFFPQQYILHFLCENGNFIYMWHFKPKCISLSMNKE